LGLKSTAGAHRTEATHAKMLWKSLPAFIKILSDLQHARESPNPYLIVSNAGAALQLNFIRREEFHTHVADVRLYLICRLEFPC
jgi:hypothetical protein